jgi:hypothetical protein
MPVYITRRVIGSVVFARDCRATFAFSVSVGIFFENSGYRMWGARRIGIRTGSGRVGGLSLKGWQIVAGGPERSADHRTTIENISHPERVSEQRWHPSGVRNTWARFPVVCSAATTGYYLPTLQAEMLSLHFHQSLSLPVLMASWRMTSIQPS